LKCLKTSVVYQTADSPVHALRANIDLSIADEFTVILDRPLRGLRQKNFPRWCGSSPTWKKITDGQVLVSGVSHDAPVEPMAMCSGTSAVPLGTVFINVTLPLQIQGRPRAGQKPLRWAFGRIGAGGF
jgi:hypothetical protein